MRELGAGSWEVRVADDGPIAVEVFYRYGYQGRDMIAIRAPFTMPHDSELIGKRLCVSKDVFEVKSLLRQGSGWIQKGEPIGVEVYRVK
jgi:hypothetical protein